MQFGSATAQKLNIISHRVVRCPYIRSSKVRRVGTRNRAAFEACPTTPSNMARRIGVSHTIVGQPRRCSNISVEVQNHVISAPRNARYAHRVRRKSIAVQITNHQQVISGLSRSCSIEVGVRRGRIPISIRPGWSSHPWIGAQPRGQFPSMLPPWQSWHPSNRRGVTRVAIALLSPEAARRPKLVEHDGQDVAFDLCAP